MRRPRIKDPWPVPVKTGRPNRSGKPRRETQFKETQIVGCPKFGARTTPPAP